MQKTVIKDIQILNKEKISITDFFPFASDSSMVHSATGEWVKASGRALPDDMNFRSDRLELSHNSYCHSDLWQVKEYYAS